MIEYDSRKASRIRSVERSAVRCHISYSWSRPYATKSMKKKIEKPSPEAKALSLFLMAYKNIDLKYKEKSKRINRLWDLVIKNELSRRGYIEEVQNLLASYGGYSEVVEKTVRYYIEKTGEWKLQGDDKYCLDAQQIADKILNK